MVKIKTTINYLDTTIHMDSAKDMTMTAQAHETDSEDMIQETKTEISSIHTLSIVVTIHAHQVVFDLETVAHDGTTNS